MVLLDEIATSVLLAKTTLVDERSYFSDIVTMALDIFYDRLSKFSHVPRKSALHQGLMGIRNNSPEEDGSLVVCQLCTGC